MESIWVSERLGPVALSYLSMPPTSECDRISVSTPFAIDFSFSAHPAALIERESGGVRNRKVPPGSGGVTGGEPFAWIRVDEPYECVEIVPPESIRRDVSDELQAHGAHELAEISAQQDPALWAVAARVRAHARGGQPISETEADEIVRTLLGHIVCEYLGGRPPRVNGRPMDRRRLDRVADYVDAHLHERILIADLADIAALSPFQFIRTFKTATSMSPHAFVTARRIERAHALLGRGDLAKAEVARRVGYKNGHHFRRMYASFFG